MSTTELLQQRAERGEPRGARQVWEEANSTAGRTVPPRSGRRGRLLAAACLVVLAGIGAYLQMDRLGDDQSVLVVGDAPLPPVDDAAPGAEAASGSDTETVPADPCAGQVVVVNATDTPGVASLATARLRARIEASRAAIGTSSGALAESLGPSPVADPRQGAHEVDESVVLLPSTACPALESLVAAGLQLDVTYRGDWPEDYRSVLDMPGIKIGADDVVVILGRDLPEPIAESYVLVPDVVGLLSESARLQLERQGFVITIVLDSVETGSPDVGRVTLQLPPSGSPALLGSLVELTVGQSTPATAEQPGDGSESAQAVIADGRLDIDEVVIVPCDGPAEPFKSGAVEHPLGSSSPIDAVTAYVESWVSTPDQPNNMPSDRWFELSLPDGRLAYGWTSYEDERSPEAFNIVLWLESDSRGWFVSAWESSGC